jgi:hypothetical protein
MSFIQDCACGTTPKSATNPLGICAGCRSRHLRDARTTRRAAIAEYLPWAVLAAAAGIGFWHGLLGGLEQAGIALFGVSAIRLSQDPREHVRRWGCIAGLCAQPFWFYTTYINGQWGIFGLSFFYTFAWLKGVRTYWLTAAGAGR